MMLAQWIVNITGTQMLIAGGVVGSLVSLYSLRGVFKHIRFKFETYRVASKVRAETDRLNAETLERDRLKREEWQREFDKQQKRRELEALLPGQWLELYDAVDAAKFYALRTSMIVQRCNSSISSNLPAGGALLFCKMVNAQHDELDKARILQVSEALAPYILTGLKEEPATKIENSCESTSECKVDGVDSDSTKCWKNKEGQYHRTDGRPAYESVNGNKYWYRNGKCHRTDGPAIEHASGSKFWYIEGKELTEEEFSNRQ